MKAADYAIEMAKKHEAQLISLYVVVSQLGYAYSSGAFGLVTPSAINELLDKSKQEARKWFDEIEKKAMAQEVNVKVEMVASPTSIVPAIVDKRTAPVGLGQTSTWQRCIRRSDLC
jgi:nucleotide-binding universal stress UspA family protein